MNCECYLRKDVVYVPTLGKVDVGFYRAVEPVAVVPVSHTAELRRTLQEAIARGNPPVPRLARAHYPDPVVLKYAGVKTWSAFERNAWVWSIDERGGVWQIIGQRKHPEGGWENDPEETLTLPAGSGADAVCDRMVAILQAKAGIARS